MVEINALRELRTKELTTLRERVERRVKLKPAPKRLRRIAGVDIVLTPQAGKIHVCACLMSYPKLAVLEEAIATDELDQVIYQRLGTVVFVPLILSVLKMLKHKYDLVMIKELPLKDEIPLASYVGVIAGRPAIGISERGTGLRKVARWDSLKRAGQIKARGHRTPVGVIAAHLVTYKDSSSLARSCLRGWRIPEPIRNAGMRVRAWEREWRRLNLEGR